MSDFATVPGTARYRYRVECTGYNVDVVLLPLLSPAGHSKNASGVGLSPAEWSSH